MKKKENRQIDWRTIQSKALDVCYELTDDYSDQIFTGKLLTAYRTHDFHPLERVPTGHTKKGVLGHTVQGHRISLIIWNINDVYYLQP